MTAGTCFESGTQEVGCLHGRAPGVGPAHRNLTARAKPDFMGGSPLGGPRHILLLLLLNSLSFPFFFFFFFFFLQ